jgi:hypothetical protein
MMGEIKPRIVRRVDFTAETLEQMAAAMPPSMKADADTMRRQAKILRESDDHRVIRVWEEQTDKT